MVRTTTHVSYNQIKFPFPRNTDPILKILLSLELIAGCDRDLFGFPKIGLWLQYGASVCGIRVLVVVGTSRIVGVREVSHMSEVLNPE